MPQSIDPQRYGFVARRTMIAAGLPVGTAALLAAVWFSRDVWLLAMAGILIGLFLNWCKLQLMRLFKIPAGIALGTILILSTVLTVLFTGFLIPVITQQSDQLLQAIPWEMEAFLYRNGWRENFQDQAENAERVLTGMDREKLMQALKGLIGIFSTTLGAVVAIGFVSLVGIGIAISPGRHLRLFIGLMPSRYRQRGVDVLMELGRVLRWWMLGQSLSMLILGTTVLAGLILLGIPNAVVLALLTAIMTFIPNLGPLIAFIPISLIALTESPLKLFYVAVFYVIIQCLEGFFITPVIHRKVITLPPVLIIVAQILMLRVAGFLGVLLAMPLVAAGLVLVQMIYIKGVLGDSDPNR